MDKQANLCLDAQYISKDDVVLIITKYRFTSDYTFIKHYEVKNASDDKILGFLGDYLKLKINIKSNNEEKELCFFIKAISRSNATKASIVKEVKLYDKELKYYELINGVMKVPAEGVFTETHPWFSQCRDGSLEIVKLYSKYSQDKEKLQVIESRWCHVFNSALTLSESSEDRTVICHRDLWNNNILFHYSDGAEGVTPEPDDCVLVDFQMVRCQPPALDVMMMLNCNLETQYRKNHLIYFLNHYYDQLKAILFKNNINIDDILTREGLISSAEKFNLWGLVTYASYVQLFWADDKLIMEIFKDAELFQEALTKDKKSFMINLIEKSEDYKKTILGVFEEIIDEYIL